MVAAPLTVRVPAKTPPAVEKSPALAVLVTTRLPNWLVPPTDRK